MIQEFTLLVDAGEPAMPRRQPTEAGRYDALRIHDRLNALAGEVPHPLSRIEALRDDALTATRRRNEAVQFASMDDAGRRGAELGRVVQFQSLVSLLDEAAAVTFQEAYLDRVRRVCPAVANDVLGAFVTIRSVAEANKVTDGMSTDDLETVITAVIQSLGMVPSTGGVPRRPRSSGRQPRCSRRVQR